ncbi:hypothetical protein GS8_1375 [Geobacillus stearothermophilus]|uniref:Uncharacterized protein n=1 Tax=Geobacillus stearothermophilus TaxID=1422 RepID=A0ABQ7HGQ7_GEOSE|nr:hypothetical protein GS8_1375 [Geobacillus stearothermophilus]
MSFLTLFKKVQTWIRAFYLFVYNIFSEISVNSKLIRFYFFTVDEHFSLQ